MNFQSSYLRIILIVHILITITHCNDKQLFSQGGNMVYNKSNNESLIGAASNTYLDLRPAGPPFEITSCEACQYKCRELRAQEYDCSHQNGFVVQCSCDKFQIWPTNCVQCESGCSGYATCHIVAGVIVCSCSSSQFCISSGNSLKPFVFPAGLTLWIFFWKLRKFLLHH